MNALYLVFALGPVVAVIGAALYLWLWPVEDQRR